MLAYTFLLAEFTFRYLRDKPVRQMHPFAWTRSARAKIAEAAAKGPGFQETLTWAEEKGAKWMLIGVAGSTGLIFVIVQQFRQRREPRWAWRARLPHEKW